MANPYRGEAPLLVGDEEIHLRITWDAIGALIGRFGPEWDIELNRAFDAFDTATVAEVLAVATGREASFFMEASPPFIKVRDAWVVAYNLFLFGVPDMEKAQAEAQEEGEKTERPLARSKSWRDAAERLIRLVWRRASSGNRPYTNASSTSPPGARA